MPTVEFTEDYQGFEKGALLSVSEAEAASLVARGVAKATADAPPAAKNAPKKDAAPA